MVVGGGGRLLRRGIALIFAVMTVVVAWVTVQGSTVASMLGSDSVSSAVAQSVSKSCGRWAVEGVLPMLVLAAFGAVAALACAFVVRPVFGCSVAWGGAVAVHGSVTVDGCGVS